MTWRSSTVTDDLAAQAEAEAKDMRPHRDAENDGKGPCPSWCPKEYDDSYTHDDRRAWAALLDDCAASLRKKDNEINLMRAEINHIIGQGYTQQVDSVELGTFSVGDVVEKVGGDYTYKGTIVSIFKKHSGVIRLVVEDDRGMLFIFNEKSLVKTHPRDDIIE